MRVLSTPSEVARGIVILSLWILDDMRVCVCCIWLSSEGVVMQIKRDDDTARVLSSDLFCAKISVVSPPKIIKS